MATANMLEPGTFDLRATLAGLAQPEEDVEFYIDKKLGYQLTRADKLIAGLEKQLALAQAAENKELEKEASQKLIAAQEVLENLRKDMKPYVAHIRGITRTKRFDIQSKALHEYPIQRDFLGNDSGEQEFLRNDYIHRSAWANYIISVTDPDGNIQEVNRDREITDFYLGNLPDRAVDEIDNAIAAIGEEGDWFRFSAQDADFS